MSNNDKVEHIISKMRPVAVDKELDYIKIAYYYNKCLCV